MQFGKLLTRAFTGPTENIGLQLFRYAIVGGIATVFDFGTLVFLKEVFGVHPLIGNIAAFVVGLTVNYLLSIFWVFSSRDMGSRTAEFLIFAAVGVAGLGISELCMYVGVDLIGCDYRLAKVGAVVGTLMWNFGVRKLLLFRNKQATLG